MRLIKDADLNKKYHNWNLIFTFALVLSNPAEKTAVRFLGQNIWGLHITDFYWIMRLLSYLGLGDHLMCARIKFTFFNKLLEALLTSGVLKLLLDFNVLSNHVSLNSSQIVKVKEQLQEMTGGKRTAAQNIHRDVLHTSNTLFHRFLCFQIA